VSNPYCTAFQLAYLRPKECAEVASAGSGDPAGRFVWGVAFIRRKVSARRRGSLSEMSRFLP
jgi:hypothetical protein